MRAQSSAEMPFLDHLEELRWRLLWSLLAVAIGVILAFAIMMRFDVIGILERPITPLMNGRKLVYTHPGDPFRIVMSSSFSLGLVLALPVIFYQLWAFVSPALYRHEKRLVIPVLGGGVLLFLAGAALAFFLVLPFTLRFLLGFQTESLEPMITASAYFGMVLSLCLTFGAVFELPIVILALTALGVVTPAFLNRYRRHAIVLCVVAAAFITPDASPTSLAIVTLPLYLLYEVSVALAIVVHRRRVRRETAASAGHVEAPA